MYNRLVKPDSLPLKSARTERLRGVFHKYASVERDGEYYMTGDDFVRKFLQPYQDNTFSDESVLLLTGIVDTDKDGVISFEEFQAFEELLCSPDAPYKAAFQLFDRNGSGSVSFEEFADVVKKTDLYKKIPFKLDGSFTRRYFGDDYKRRNSYAEFTLLIHDFIDEYATQAFRKSDPSGTGYILPAHFKDIVIAVKGHMLTEQMKDSLGNITSGRTVSFCFFKGFLSLLSKMEVIKTMYLELTKGDREKAVTKDELLHAIQAVDSVIPLEIGILFQLNVYISASVPGTIVYRDFVNIVPEPYGKVIRLPAQTPMQQVLENSHKLLLGFAAAAFGATALYPIDLVKTRMQNQRSALLGDKAVHKNSWECFKTVLHREGPAGLYRGLLPQLLGIGPEKTIKLSVNDYLRDKFSDEQGFIETYSEVLAGCCSGAAQIIITNPMEVVKIRLQVAGEVGQKIGTVSVVQQLGFSGLYRGSMACLLRDVLFTSIYFPAYARAKALFVDEDGTNHPMSLLAAGVIAAIPAACLATPADVVKTRLQVAARQGQTTYDGLLDATRKMMREEGPTAFWKGTAARVLRSAPHLGITVMVYELLRVTLKRSGQAEPDKTNPDHIGGYRAIVPTISSIESNFGLYLPRYERRKPPDES